MPSVTTLKSYTRSNIEKPGECAQRLEGERTQYNECIAEATKAGKKPPLSEEVLIADEVKVSAKLHWNSRLDSIVGHSMTANEMATLRDLYAVLNNESQVAKADYILQTLWRDTSSNCDIVGPYYSSCGGFKAKYMIACLMDSLQKLDSFGSHVSMLVVDGASANLSMLRLLMGTTGVFGFNSASEDPHRISPCFTNPFTGRIHVIICPSHQIIIFMECVSSSVTIHCTCTSVQHVYMYTSCMSDTQLHLNYSS